MNKICRICLEDGVLTSLFIKNYNFTLSLSEMIEYCCNVKIDRNDGLPEQMCSNCIYKLGVAYHFKQTYQGADVRLHQSLGIQKYNRFMDASVMTDPIAPIRQTIIKKCKCKLQQRSRSSYKRKPESEKLKRGPKPKPKQNHTCCQCNKEFRCQAQLDMHLRTHTGDKPFHCMYCPRSFSQKHNLTIHLRTHTGEKPFQCKVCSKSFSAQGNLQAHIKIHSGQKDHTCSVCSKAFITSSELTRHLNKHKGVKNFKCDLCDKEYIHARDLKLHKLKKHPVPPSIHQNKIQSEKYSSNIDVIGIDVGKDLPAPMPLKEDHGIHNVAHKNEQNLSMLNEHSIFSSYIHHVPSNQTNK